MFRPLAEAPDLSRGLWLGLEASFSVGIAYLGAISYQEDRGLVAAELDEHYQSAVTIAAVVLMISMMHNAVHSAPGLFGAMFSPEWATEVTEVTEPNSLYLRGEVIHFVKPEEVEVIEEEKTEEVVEPEQEKTAEEEKLYHPKAEKILCLTSVIAMAWA